MHQQHRIITLLVLVADIKCSLCAQIPHASFSSDIQTGQII